MTKDAPSPFDDQGRQFAWDATSISLAETCLRKYYYTIIRGLQPHHKSAHLLFGGWYAEAVEHYYKYLAEGTSKDDALRRVVLEALTNTWVHKRNDNGERVVGTGGPWISDHNAKTRENLIRTIVWYFDTFEGSDVELVHLPDGQPAVEYSFSLPVDDDLIFSGHIDRLVDWGGDVYVMDQKTTGYTITPKYFDGFKPDTQMSMYTFAGKIIYNNPVKGVIIDAAQIAVGFSRFERGFTFRTEAELEEWYDSTMYHIAAARLATERSEWPMNRSKCGSHLDHFPMRSSSCRDYGGCAFRRICSQSPDVREKWIKTDFIEGEGWNPLKPR